MGCHRGIDRYRLHMGCSGGITYYTWDAMEVLLTTHGMPWRYCSISITYGMQWRYYLLHMGFHGGIDTYRLHMGCNGGIDRYRLHLPGIATLTSYIHIHIFLVGPFCFRSIQ